MQAPPPVSLFCDLFVIHNRAEMCTLCVKFYDERQAVFLRHRKHAEAKGSTLKQNEQITRTESETISITESKSGTVSKTETESDGCSAPANAGISVLLRAYGEFVSPLSV